MIITSKMKMFAMTDTAIINMDSDHADIVLEHAWASARRVITFAVTDKRTCTEEMKLDLCIHDEKEGAGDRFQSEIHRDRTGNSGCFDEQFELTMPGFFNVENALGVIAAAVCLEIPRNISKAESEERDPAAGWKPQSAGTVRLQLLLYAHNKLSFEKLTGRP